MKTSDDFMVQHAGSLVLQAARLQSQLAAAGESLSAGFEAMQRCLPQVDGDTFAQIMAVPQFREWHEQRQSPAT